MEEKVMAPKVMRVLAGIARQAAGIAPETIDFAVALDEIRDCLYLLEDGFGEEAVKKVVDQTTCGELHDLLNQEEKKRNDGTPAGGDGSFTVTIEEHISQDFHINADSVEEAMQKAEDAYNAGDLVVEPAPPTARLMQARNATTGEETEWTEF